MKRKEVSGKVNRVKDNMLTVFVATCMVLITVACVVKLISPKKQITETVTEVYTVSEPVTVVEEIPTTVEISIETTAEEVVTYNVLTAVNGVEQVQYADSELSIPDWLYDYRVLKISMEDDEYVFNTTADNYVIYPDSYDVTDDLITCRVDFVWNDEILEYHVYVDRISREIRVDV